MRKVIRHARIIIGQKMSYISRYEDGPLKYLPPELVDWYFPFNWDVAAIWKLGGATIKREVASLEWHLDTPLWSSERGKGMLFNLRPRKVLANPQEHFYHWNRIEQADTSYSICVTKFKGRGV